MTFDNRRPPSADQASAVDTTACQACGAHGDLERFTVRSLADGAERTEWSCTDAAACHERQFPGLAGLLATGWPSTTAEAAADAEQREPKAGREAEL